MKKFTPENKFFLIFLLTIIVTRISLYVAGLYASDADNIGLTLFGFRLHHYMYGLVLIPLGIIIANVFLYAIGLGLFVDELTYLLIGGTTHADNYSWISLVGTGIFVLLFFGIRKQVVKIVNIAQKAR